MTKCKKTSACTFFLNLPVSNIIKIRKGKSCVDTGCYKISRLSKNGFLTSTHARQGKNEIKVFTISDDQESNNGNGTRKYSLDPITNKHFYR